MTLETFIILFFGSFLLAIPAVTSPGPVSIAVVNEGARRGARVGPLVSIGHAIPELIIVLLIALGLTTFMQAPLIRLLIALLGGLFLLWMGASFIIAAWRGTMRLPQVGEGDIPPMNARQMVGLGISTTLSNPYWYTWWVTVGAGILLSWQEDLGLIVAPVFFAGHIIVDFGWNTFLAGVVASGRRWLTDRRYRALVILTSLFLLYVGVGFLIEGGAMLAG